MRAGHALLVLLLLAAVPVSAKPSSLDVSIEIDRTSVGYPEPIRGAVILRNRGKAPLLVESASSVQVWDFESRAHLTGPHLEFRQGGEWQACSPETDRRDAPVEIPPGAIVRRPADRLRGLCHADYRPGPLELRFVYQALRKAESGLVEGPIYSRPVHLTIQPYTAADVAFMEDEADGSLAAAIRHPDSLFAGVAMDRALYDADEAGRAVAAETPEARRKLLTTIDRFLWRFPTYPSRRVLILNSLLRRAALGDVEGAARDIPLLGKLDGRARDESERVLFRTWARAGYADATGQQPCHGSGVLGSRSPARPRVGLMLDWFGVQRTRDGGLTFERVSEASGENWQYEDLAFRSPRSAVLAGRATLVTDDDGDHWRRLPQPLPGAHGLAFGDDRVGLVIASRFMRTEDGGEHWTAVELPAGTDVIGLAFSDARRASAMTAEPSILSSQDGGRTWEKRWGGPRDRLLTAVAFRERIGLAVGEKGLVLRTVDGGRHWTALQGRGLGRVPPDLYGVALADGQTAVTYSDPDKVFRSIDGGRSWRPALGDVNQPEQPQPPVSNSFEEDEDSAMRPRLLRLSDSEGFYRHQRLSQWWIGRIVFASDGVGLLFTADAVLRTVDGGRTWMRLSTGMSQPPRQGALAPVSRESGPLSVERAPGRCEEPVQPTPVGAH